MYVTERSSWYLLFAFRWSCVEQNFPWPGSSLAQSERSGKQRVDLSMPSILRSPLRTYKRAFYMYVHKNLRTCRPSHTSVERYYCTKQRKWVVIGNGRTFSQKGGGTDLNVKDCTSDCTICTTYTCGHSVTIPNIPAPSSLYDFGFSCMCLIGSFP
jgi:hypothetical protein